MKLLQKLESRALLLVCLVSFSGLGQTYQMSGVPLTGYMDLLLSDWGNNTPGWTMPPGGTYGGRTTSLSVDDTIYIDTAAQTIRQVGYISLGYTLNDARTVQKQINGVWVSASVTVDQWSGYGGGPLRFDTGPRPYVWDPSSQTFTFDGRLGVSGTVKGQYSLATGGETFGGPFSYTLTGSVAGYSAFSPESTFSVLGDSYTVRTLSGWGLATPDFTLNRLQGTGGVGVTAANGFQLGLSPGASDHWDFFSASAQPDWAFLVPEPSASWMIGFGLAGLILRKRKGVSS